RRRAAPPPALKLAPYRASGENVSHRDSKGRVLASICDLHREQVAWNLPRLRLDASRLEVSGLLLVDDAVHSEREQDVGCVLGGPRWVDEPVDPPWTLPVPRHTVARPIEPDDRWLILRAGEQRHAIERDVLATTTSSAEVHLLHYRPGPSL